MEIQIGVEGGEGKKMKYILLGFLHDVNFPLLNFDVEAEFFFRGGESVCLLESAAATNVDVVCEARECFSVELNGFLQHNKKRGGDSKFLCPLLFSRSKILLDF